jgi:hypothetical protein
MTFIIYKIRHCNYIGSTENIKQRKWRHITSCRIKNNPNHNNSVYKHLRENNIKIELIPLAIYRKKCSYRIRTLVEQYWINKFNSIDNGYNTNKSFSSKKDTKEKQRKQSKIYRETNKEQCSKYKKEYHKKNRDEILRKGKIYYQNNIEEKRKYHKEYRKKNKEAIKKKFLKGKDKYNKNRMVKLQCINCGFMTAKSNMKRHLRSKKCLNFKNNI